MTNTANDIPEELRELSQSALVVMFYDQAMTALEDAIDAIDEGDIERRFNAVKVGTGLISQLALSLDDQSGGEIAHNLGSIYDFILARLPQINIKNDPVPAEEAIKLLRPLRDAWAELDRRIAAGEIDGHASTPAFADDAKETTADRKAA